MRHFILTLLIVLPSLVYGQCGSVFKNGIEYSIPCDWDYLKHSSDSLRKQEQLFIEYINLERRKKKLGPLVYDQTLYENVATPQAIRMSMDGFTSHTNANVYECCTGLFYGYRKTNLAYNAIRVFKTSQDHWNILMLTGTSKIAVRIEIDPKKSINKRGEVYMSVVID